MNAIYSSQGARTISLALVKVEDIMNCRSCRRIHHCLRYYPAAQQSNINQHSTRGRKDGYDCRFVIYSSGLFVGRPGCKLLPSMYLLIKAQPLVVVARLCPD